MKVVVFTRTWRISPGIVLGSLLDKGVNIEGVFLEDRMEMVLAGAEKKVYVSKLWGFIKRYGLVYILEKVWEMVLIKLHYVVRRFLNPWAGRLFYSVEEVTLYHPLNVFRVPSHNSQETLKLLEEIKPDVLVTVNSRILKEDVLKRVRWAINLHLSALPKYGGMDSIFWALYHGEKEIGVTVHLLESRLDAGGIIEQGFIPVEKGDTERKLYFKALDSGKELVYKALKKIEDGNVETKRQGKVEYFGIPTKKERMELKRSKALSPPPNLPPSRGRD